MTSSSPTLFQPGVVVATFAALRVLFRAGLSPTDVLTRHTSGDWGDICPEDQRANNEALAKGGRILSSFEVQVHGETTTLWLITEHDHSSTTILLPAEY